ncbi:Vacuolar protein sorting-associated protein 72 like [Pseudolycoriella hygida]|uniref:Vacuolar protein sorting-associated protein 72 homolog n=1 Tax=Pseudolycoriella hygida TaxID=35572 RepID=A0A9Q0MSN4_9DIPT|nr:Vacuolar protein sorting-associated protein 72 like [Pseudolycoriella hygida]
MAATRERRGNAGAKMAKLLDEEEEDEFYKTSYGGFEETENDRDYVQKNDDEDDIVDSDFSIEENDEPISENEEETKTRRKTTNKRAYKEPPKKSNQVKEQKKKVKVKKISTKRLKMKRQTYTVLDSAKISLRKSTALKSAATEHRIKARTEAAKKKPKSLKSDDWIPTQEELLEEALITEEENLASLEKFKQMEIEKKKSRPTKRIFSGPTIRYHSLSMPLVETKRTRESNRSVPNSVSQEDLSTKTEDEESNRKSIAVSTGPRCERTFVSFENDVREDAFNSIFKPSVKRPNGGYICSITKMPARYFDPITRLPYRNKEAFKVVREAYYQYLEAWADPKALDLEKWLAHRAKVKDQRNKLKKLNHAQGI